MERGGGGGGGGGGILQEALDLIFSERESSLSLEIRLSDSQQSSGQ